MMVVQRRRVTEVDDDRPRILILDNTAALDVVIADYTHRVMTQPFCSPEVGGLVTLAPEPKTPFYIWGPRPDANRHERRKAKALRRRS